MVSLSKSNEKGKRKTFKVFPKFDNRYQIGILKHRHNQALIQKVPKVGG